MKIKRRKEMEPEKGHNRAGVFTGEANMLTIFVRYGLGLSMNGWVGGRDDCIKQLEKYPGSNDNETSLLVLGELRCAGVRC